MPTLNISKATGFIWRIETGVGTINAGAFIDGNYLYEDIGTFMNCSTINTNEIKCPDMYHSDETVSFQVEYDNSGAAPAVAVYDNSDDSFVIGVGMTNTTGNIWEGTVDMADLGEGCFYLKILSGGSASGQNAWTGGDFGTMEANINGLSQSNTGNFAIAQSSTYAQAGTYSYKRSDLTGTPAANDKLHLYQDASHDLSSHPVWEIKGYVLTPTGKPINVAGDIFWDVTNSDGFGTPASAITGFTDANIISQTVWNAVTDGPSTTTFTEVSTIFSLGTVTDAHLRLTSENTPEVSGELFVDTITLRQVTGTVTEATSEPFCVKSSIDCSAGITYTNDDDGFDIEYSTGNIEHFMRVFWQGLGRFGFEDEDYTTQRNSAGDFSTIIAFPAKIYRVIFELMTPNKCEKLLLALRHDIVKINGVEMVLIDGSQEPEVEPETEIHRVEVNLAVKSYPYQNSNC